MTTFSQGIIAENGAKERKKAQTPKRGDKPIALSAPYMVYFMTCVIEDVALNPS